MVILMWEVSSSSNVAFSINVDKELDDGIEGLIVEIMDGRSVSLPGGELDEAAEGLDEGSADGVDNGESLGKLVGGGGSSSS